MGCIQSQGVHRDEDIRHRAALKIASVARRSVVRKRTKEAMLWKMFTDLDTQDEAETLELAVFMQTLVDLVPTEDAPNGNLMISEKLLLTPPSNPPSLQRLRPPENHPTFTNWG